MKKKLTALFLAVAMCMTMSAPAFAVESTSVAAMEKAAHEDAIRADIMRQLEAQDAVHLYDAFAAILLPDEDGAAQPRSTQAIRIEAPDGGYLYYTLPYTYRGEEGTYTYAIAHFDYEDSQALMTAIDHSLTTATFLIETYGAPIYSIVDAVAWGYFSLATIAHNVSAGLVQDADGYARVITVEASIDDTCATVVAGWETHEEMVIEEADARNISFDLFPEN